MFDRLLFAAPHCTYSKGEIADELDGALCWLPWNEDIPAPPTLGTKKATAAGDAVPLPGPEGQAGQTAGIRTSCGCVSPSCNYCQDHCCSAAHSQVIDDSRIPVYNGHVADSLPCLWFEASNSSTVFLVCHANAEDLGLFYETAQTLHEHFQASVLVIEYPGYGLLQGLRASEENCYRAALVAMRYLVVELGVSYSQVVLLGRSMGSGPALFLASKFPVAGVILINSFMSVSDVAEKYLGRLSSLAYGEVFMNKRMIKHVSSPVLFIHAIADKIVPALHSTRLFEKCPTRKLLVTPDGMDHNSNCFERADFLILPALRFFRFLGRRGNRRPPRRMPSELFGRQPNPLAATVQARPDGTCTLSYDEDFFSETADPSNVGWGPWITSRLPSCVVVQSPCITTLLHQEWREEGYLNEEPAEMVCGRSHSFSPSVKRSHWSAHRNARSRQRRPCLSCCVRQNDTDEKLLLTKSLQQEASTDTEPQTSDLLQLQLEDCSEPPLSCKSNSVCPERFKMKQCVNPGSPNNSDHPLHRPPQDARGLDESVPRPEQDDDCPNGSSESCVAKPLSAGDPFCGRWARPARPAGRGRPGRAAASTSRSIERQPSVAPLTLLSPRTGQPKG